MSKPYNGHPSWNAWNVSLWISNDEGLYNLALDCIKNNKNKRTGKTRYFGAACSFIASVDPRTPDGARYFIHSVTLALKGLES